jgi:hypothetical protein
VRSNVLLKPVRLADESVAGKDVNADPVTIRERKTAVCPDPVTAILLVTTSFKA